MFFCRLLAPNIIAAAAVGIVVTVFAGSTFAQPSTLEATDSKKELRFAALEKQLAGAVLVGNFTTTGKGKNVQLTAERYYLKSVRHLEDDRWLFTARIKYGEHDVTVPLTLPIRWAGDTPVISLDTFPIPGLGTYTARVMIYADHYAGFWSGGDHGGHLFGVVERDKKKDKMP